jgi:hypothetical protein
MAPLLDLPRHGGPTMVEVPFHLQYTLSRSQRLVTLLGRSGLLHRVWGPAFLLFFILLLVFWMIRAVASLLDRDLVGIAVFGGLALGSSLLYGDLVGGLLDIIRIPARPMDIVFEENAADILLGGERWRLFLDGIMSIEKYRDDVWAIQHWNGVVLNIPASAMTDEQVKWIRAAMERGHTPEGRQAILERGRRIERILIKMAEERRESRS